LVWTDVELGNEEATRHEGRALIRDIVRRPEVDGCLKKRRLSPDDY
jgi:hypothetical protein